MPRKGVFICLMAEVALLHFVILNGPVCLWPLLCNKANAGKKTKLIEQQMYTLGPTKQTPKELQEEQTNFTLQQAPFYLMWNNLKLLY